MKRLLYIFISFLTAGSCFGQTDTSATTAKKNIWGANTGTLISNGSWGFNYYLYLSVDKGKSFFAVGPVLGPKLKMTRYSTLQVTKNQNNLNGFHLVYQINPYSKGKTFDFFFQYQFIFLYYTDKDVHNNGNYYPAIVNEPYKSHQTDIEYYIGYGFKSKFLKNLYLTQTAGIGLIIEYTLVDYDNNIYDNNRGFYGPSLMINMGLGYKFDNKK